MAETTSAFILERAILKAVREEVERIAEEEAAKARAAIDLRIGAAIGSIVLQVSKNYSLERDGPDIRIIVRDQRGEGEGRR